VNDLIQQIAVINENGTQIGMTFPKRAKQLIARQRALWHNDSHTAICLLPELKEEVILDKDFTYNTNDGFKEAPRCAKSDDLLLYLAKKNVAERKNLIKQAVIYAIAWTVLLVVYAGFWDGADNYLSREGRNAINTLEVSMPFIPEAYVPNIEYAIAVINTYTYMYQRPVGNYILGAMFAWGGWIVFHAIKRAAENSRPKGAKRIKPDPVAVEYQRLKNIVLDGAAIEKV